MRPRTITLTGLVSLFFLAAVSSPALAHTIERVSVASNGSEANGHSSYYLTISADGRFVGFSSYASNLVPGDTNACADVFVHDRLTGLTERVSVASDGGQANGGSSYPAISADGRFVAFASDASDLVPGDTNGCGDVFVHDRVMGQTERVSVASDGLQGNRNSGNGVSISADGRFVAFDSGASNLVPNDTNGSIDVFVHDRLTSLTEHVSVASDGTQGNGQSDEPSISADGRCVVFRSLAGNLVPEGNAGWQEVFAHDRVTGQTECVSVASIGSQGNGPSVGPSITPDGRFVAFSSDATNLVPADSNGYHDVFVHDRVSGHTERVSVASDSSEGNEQSRDPSISADGRFVAFQSVASDLVSADTNAAYDTFVHDRATGQTERVSTSFDGTQGNARSYSRPSISSDGRSVAFCSEASNLVPQDTNGAWDVFVASNDLFEPGRLSGQVRVLGTNTNLAGATVAAYLGSSSTPSATAIADANGIYEISGLGTGTYTVVASMSGYVRQTKPGIAVTAGAATYVNFGLAVSGKLKGQVLDKMSGTPIVGATIIARTGGVVWATGVTTAPYGIYEITSDLPAGTYSLLAAKTGYQDQGKVGVVVSSGATTYVNFFLNKVCLMGQVRQAGTSTNLAGATVAAYVGSATTPSATATADANGIYQIGGLTTGTYTVIASKSGYVKQTKPGIVVTAGVTSYVNFNLQVSGKLKGQVTEKGTGVPIIGATVSARTGGVVRATGTTVGPYGVYEIASDLPAGTYSVLCQRAGYQDFGRIGIVVTAGNTTYVNFPMQPKPTGVSSYLGDLFMSVYTDPVANIGLIVRDDGSVSGAAFFGGPVQNLDVFFSGSADSSNTLTASGRLIGNGGTQDVGSFTITGTFGNFPDGSSVKGTFTAQGVGAGSGTWRGFIYNVYPLGAYLGTYSGGAQGKIAIMNFAVDDSVLMIQQDSNLRVDWFASDLGSVTLTPPAVAGEPYGLSASNGFYATGFSLTGTVGVLQPGGALDPFRSRGPWEQAATPSPLTGIWSASKPTGGAAGSRSAPAGPMRTRRLRA